ncbi:acyl carrier protein [Actinomycetes bacterium KLBMP 9797]
MREFTQADLTRIMRDTVGVDDSVDLDADILDTAFTDLGYDSLAVLEVANTIVKEYGVSISDSAVGDMETPRHLVDHVNGQLAAVPS